MSRIILSRYSDGQARVVVGYDHPCSGAFFQEFAHEPADGDDDYDDYEEIIRDGGFFQGIPLDEFRDAVPEDLRLLITDEVMELLAEHAADPDSGYNARPIDLSQR